MSRLKFPPLVASYCVLLLILSSCATCEKDVKESLERTVQDGVYNREGKLFSLLQIVTFPNKACSGSGNMNGTCYTSSECDSRGGTNSGDCASGYGVCCTFSIGCGSTSSENCTYFTVSGASAGQCRSTICPCNSNICQLRLDFISFDIAGPSSTSVSSFTQLAGQPVTTGGQPASINSQCVTDTFSVTSPNGNGPPVICGTNTGEHMYVESSSECNDLSFQIGSTTTSTARNFNIKVTQYSCDYDNLAPTGCTQYFFGSTGQLVQTFNYDGGNGQHLANQDQTICVRRERGQCRICYSAMATTDFMLSGPTATNNLQQPTRCCNYGVPGNTVRGYDCLFIPGAMNAAGTPANSRYCGRKRISGGSTRCTNMAPFFIHFKSDSFEHAGAAILEAGNADLGFRIAYWMDTTNCAIA